MDILRLKICGLRDNVKEVEALQPDYAGFIFYPKSPRFVGEDFSMPELDKRIKKVGVFVNETVAKMIEIVRKYHLDFVQLHGHEKPDDCQAIGKQGIGVIKAFAIDEHFDFSQLEQYDSTVDYFLFDTRTAGFGGSGRSFDWELLKKYKLGKKYFLSGGLGLDNIEDLKDIELRNIHALDVNSRFEIKPGLKNIELLQKLKKKLNH